MFFFFFLREKIMHKTYLVFYWWLLLQGPSTVEFLWYFSCKILWCCGEILLPRFDTVPLSSTMVLWQSITIFYHSIVAMFIHRIICMRITTLPFRIFSLSLSGFAYSTSIVGRHSVNGAFFQDLETSLQRKENSFFLFLIPTPQQSHQNVGGGFFTSCTLNMCLDVIRQLLI